MLALTLPVDPIAMLHSPIMRHAPLIPTTSKLVYMGGAWSNGPVGVHMQGAARYTLSEVLARTTCLQRLPKGTAL